MEINDVLQKLSEARGVAGHENEAAELAVSYFQPYVDKIKRDNLGNLVAYKKGALRSRRRPSVFLAAHLDEIGLIVTEVTENGFLRFSTIGGFDPRTLWGQAVMVHGRRDLPGVIGPKSPHLVSQEEAGKELRIEDMHIDVALSKEKAEELVRVGDTVSIHRDFMEMKNSACVTGKALDDRAGVACLIQTARQLQRMVHDFDVYFVGTVQEEVGTRGAITSTYSIMPDIGVAVDVCHGNMPGVTEEDSSELGKGPAISVGPNIHPVLGDKLKEVAKQHRISYDIEAEPGVTPTDARAIQVTREGVPCALVSIPVRYMHTSVEVIHTEDLNLAGQLLAYFIADINHEFLQEVKDYD